MNFPGSLDAFTNPTSGDTLDNPPHDQQHADVNDAVEALQAKVGVDNSAVTSSLDYRVAGVEQALSSRNLLYNGAMQVAQRGTSTTGITSSGYYTADRFRLALGSQGTWTHTIENDGPDGYPKSFKMLCSTADSTPASGDFVAFQQYLEGYDVQSIKKGTSSANQLTLSFWVKSNVTGTYIAELRDDDNNRQVSKSYTINASATWEQKLLTFPADTTGVFNNDNSSSLSLILWQGAGSTYSSGTLNTSWASAVSANRAAGQVNLASAVNNYWQITGVQLEVGDKATPFEHLPYGVELAKCQRYHFTLNNSGSTTGVLGYGGVLITNSAGNVPIQCPVPMRAKPTAVGTVGSIQLTDLYVFGANVTSITILANSTTENAVFVQAITGSTAFTVGRVAYLIASSDATARLAFSAEL